MTFLDMLKRLWSKLATTQADATLLKRFGKNFSISAAGSVASALLAFGRTVLLAKMLPVEGYGRILIVLDLFAFLILFLDLRIHDVLYRFYPAFEEQGRPQAVATLLAAGLLACLGLGLVLSGSLFLLAPWMASTIYDAPVLGPMLQVYAVAVIFSAFKGFYVPVLRIRDRFSAIVVPDVVANLVVVGALAVYFVGLGARGLLGVVVVFAVAEMVRTLPPLVMALRCEWGRLRDERKHLSTLQSDRKAILSTLWHTNLTGYLKLGSEQGGAFLLGVLSTPTQVALYGIARQLTRPLIMLQGNVQTAVAPEIFTLAAQRKYEQLRRLVNRFLVAKLAIGISIMAAALFLARPVILMVAKPEYMAAAPIFLVICATIVLSFISLAFYPLTVALDRMLRRNVTVASRLLYLAGAVLTGLNAFSLALAQLAGSATTRLGCDLVVYRDLTRQADSTTDTSLSAQHEAHATQAAAKEHAAAASPTVPSAETEAE
jgi:O-antigen/teichoic acid export membrane protein